MNKVLYKEITSTNIDDYIRQQKRVGQKHFLWSGRALNAFKIFCESVFSDPLVGYPEKYFSIKKDGNVIKKPTWRNFPEEFIFMGVEHQKYYKKIS